MKRLALGALLLVCWNAGAGDPPFTYTPEIAAAISRVSELSLKGSLAFLSSDLLEGRDTPSRGLEIAGEYIAAQFRRAGLEPARGSYFQNAPFVLREPGPVSLKLDDGTEVPASSVAATVPAVLNLERIPVVRVDEDKENVAGKAALLEGSLSYRRLREVRALKPAVILYHDISGAMVGQYSTARLADPEDRGTGAPLLVVNDDRLSAAKTVTVRIPAPVEKPVALRNVIGVLRGSDPRLRDTYVLVTAHYDHLGRQRGCTTGDCIYNGANDDGSGTVSVIETARALASLPRRPRRTVVFMTFFGEEKGGLGSRYYARHPVFPLAATVADVNLEQLGRTDSDTGPQIGTATFTGFTFTNLPKTFQAAGRLTGVKVYNSAVSDDYFSRSDNQMLADAGIPAHTMCVAYSYPDYHGLGDEWEKVDFANLARVDRMVALGVLMLASNPEPPRWDASNPKTQSYVQAWKHTHAE